MGNSRLSVILISILISVIFVAGDSTCTKLGSCSCQFENHTWIDLSVINVVSDIMFKDVKDTNNSYGVSFFPCQDSLLEVTGSPSECNKPPGVAVCVHHGEKYINLGRHDSVQFKSEKEVVYLQYSILDNSALVKLVCEHNSIGRLQVDGCSEKQCNLTLHSQCACPSGCPLLQLKAEGGLSPGSVLIILLMVFSSLYFFGGMLILKLIRGAEGQEMIPNYEFWKDLPSLVQDGCTFVCRGCQAEATYDRI